MIYQNDELAEAYGNVARKQKLSVMHAQLQRDKAQLEQHLEALKAALDKEELELSRLENGGIAALFYSILGSRDEHIRKEREEALAARLKYEQAGRELADINGRITALTAELRALDGCEARYAALFEQKKTRLLNEMGEDSRRIMALAEDIAHTKANLKEIREAMEAGDSALGYLDSALKSLRKAENWGTYDMLGGGMISGMVKHDHIDRAADSVSCAQLALNNFRTELADINVRSDISVRIGDFARFADFFFDGLIADWYVQNAIGKSMDSVAAALSDAANARFTLDSLYKADQGRFQQLQTELESLVLRA